MRKVAVLVAGAILMVAPAASSHDIPRDVTVQAFARPEGQRLRLLVRVPLKSMTDVEFPRRERDFVDLTRVDDALRDAATVYVANQIDVYEDASRLPAPRVAAVRMSLDSDRSFTSYDEALAHVTGAPLPASVTIYWEQGLLEALLEYPIQSDRSAFAIDARFDKLAEHVVTSLRFLPPGGTVRAFELEGDAGLVRLDPRWHQAALRFVNLGFFHILSGADHLLFLFCLVIPFRRLRALVPVVTAFTVAHSITLMASAYGYAPDAQWFPPLVETLIAASIVYMALENIVLQDGSGAAGRLGRRWIVAFAFGLVHGFGFSFGLQHTLQFAGTHLLTSLLSFNVGVEIGQLLVLCLLVPVLDILFRAVVAERMGTIVLSAIVAHTAWHWMTDRFGVLSQYPWPVVTAAALVAGIRWLMLALAVGGAIAIWRVRARNWSGVSSPTEPETQRG